MKIFLIIGLLGWLGVLPAAAQGTLLFDLRFGDSAPPHNSLVPASGAILDGDTFSIAIYLDQEAPALGRIVSSAGSPSQTVFTFGNPVYAAYPPETGGGGAAFSYEGTWVLSSQQIQELTSGAWSAEFAIGGATYSAHITPVPEPSVEVLFTVGTCVLGSVVATRRKTLAPKGLDHLLS